MKKAIKVNAKDNVVIVLSSLLAGDEICFGNRTLTVVTDAPAFHKIAIDNIVKGENVVKYGVPIGVATQVICKGEHIHVHNVDSVETMQRVVKEV